MQNIGIKSVIVENVKLTQKKCAMWSCRREWWKTWSQSLLYRLLHLHP